MVEINTVEKLAETYVAGIRDIPPKGPYRIAGYSFGAVVALEISQPLQAFGEEVEQLLILDPFKLLRTAIHDPETLKRVGSSSSTAARLSAFGRTGSNQFRRPGIRRFVIDAPQTFAPLQGRCFR